MIYYKVNDRGKGTQQCAPSFLYIAIGLQRDYQFFLKYNQQKLYNSRQAPIDVLKGWFESRAHSASKPSVEYGEGLQQLFGKGRYLHAGHAVAANTNKIPPQRLVLLGTIDDNTFLW